MQEITYQIYPYVFFWVQVLRGLKIYMYNFLELERIIPIDISHTLRVPD